VARAQTLIGRRRNMIRTIGFINNDDDDYYIDNDDVGDDDDDDDDDDDVDDITKRHP
jgi:hypothetical protein